ncbi:MAG: class A beta-lactamase-related serine hydrolase [Solirubrobacterales bacterium]|nr:class A beta-lactamase-related serine hydrolase [Solirubrobacterales bacterium]
MLSAGVVVGILAALAVSTNARAGSGVRITAGPAAESVIRTSAPVFRFSSPEGGARFRCRLDQGQSFTCKPPLRLRALTDGWHRLRVSAVDQDGIELSVVKRRFRVDTVPPKSRIGTAPRRLIRTIERTVRAVVGFRGRHGAKRFECRLDRAGWSPCRPPFRRRVGPGRHRFAVRAIDAAGNVERHPVIRRWRVRRWEPGLRSARRYARRRAGPVSFAVDVGWRRQGFRMALRARSASTIKTVLMVAYLNRRKVRHRRLTRSERGRLGVMIRHSDNGAATAVRDRVGARGIKRLARRAGMKDFRYSPIWGICRVSARDYARLMRRLPDLLPRRHRRFALRQLAGITRSQRWGVGRIRIRGWGRYFKGGWGISDGGHGGVVSHQMLLLKRGRWRIGVAILTQGNPSVGYGNGTLRGVARRLLRGLPH